MGGGRRELWRRWMVAGVAVAAAVTVATLTGIREPASALRLLSGDAWLGNRATGTVSHVQGYARRVDAPVPVSGAHDPFTIVQRPDGAYVLDTRTGVLTRVSASSLDATASRPLPGRPSALVVSTGGAVTWTIDTSSGVVQQVDPTTLTPIRPQIALGGPVGSTVTDGSGSLWAALPGQGVVVQVDPGSSAITRHMVGQAGDALQLVTTADGPWAVDPQAGTVTSLSNPGAPAAHIPQTASGAAAPVVASNPISPAVVVVSGQVVTEVDTATAAVTGLQDLRAPGARQAVIANEQVYLLDGASNQVDVLGLDPLAVLGQIPVPAGSDQLVTHDNLVFVNNDGTPAAAVIDQAGQVTPITKYQVAPTAGPRADTLAATQPTPVTPTPSAMPGSYPVAPGPAIGPSASPIPPPVLPPVLPPVGSPPAPMTSPTVPSPPGAPTITSVSGGAGTLDVGWQPGSGTPPTGFVVSVGLASGGQTTQTPEPASASHASIGSLQRGVSYCAQVQAEGPSATQGSQLSARVCASTVPLAPGPPTNLSFVPLNQGAQISFGPATNGTTYTLSLNGKVTQSHVAAGTYPVIIPGSKASPPRATVTVTSDPNAGGPGQAATLAVDGYFTTPIVDCANNTGVFYSQSSPCAAGTTTTVASASWATDNGLGATPGYETLCSYIPQGTKASPYVVMAGDGTYSQAPGAAPLVCPPPPSGYMPGTPGAGGSWTTSGGTHTALVQAWTLSLSTGYRYTAITGPGETPAQVLGIPASEIVGAPTLVAHWYDDPGP